MKYNIRNSAGEVIYTNLVRSSRIQGYDWNDNYGHITDSLISHEQWSVEVA
jgi:hypothetical protein